MITTPPSTRQCSNELLTALTSGAQREAEKVYYTLDGSDPRSPTAHSFSEAVLTVPFSPNLKGRSRRDDEWSALNEYGTWERE